MARYLHRNCPRCHGYVAIVLPEPGRNSRLQAVNGKCLGCSYRLAWIVIRVVVVPLPVMTDPAVKLLIEKDVFNDAEFKLDTDRANYLAVLKRVH
jgi:hypothetical protein